MTVSNPTSLSAPLSYRALEKKPVKMMAVQRICSVGFLLLLTVNSSAFARDLINLAVPVVIWRSGRLTVKANDVPLNLVLKEISRQTDLRVTSATSLRRPINVEIMGLSLVSALESLLTRENFAIVEKPAADGVSASVAVIILGEAKTARAAEPANKTGADERNNESANRLKSLINRIEGGGPQTERILQQAAYDSDPNVSALAMQTLAERNSQTGRDVIRRVAETGSGSTRFAALQEMSQLADRRSLLPELAVALHESDTDLKGYALQMLLQDGSPEAMQIVRQARNDPDPSFRDAVNAALANH